MNSSREFTSQERAMLVAWALRDGERLTVQMVAQLTGLGTRAARRLLVRAERALPVFKEGGHWRKL